MKVKTKKDGTVAIRVPRETADKLAALTGRSSGREYDLVELYAALVEHTSPKTYRVRTGVAGVPVAVLELVKQDVAR